MATVHSTPTGTLLILECRPLADSLMADSACSLPAWENNVRCYGTRKILKSTNYR